MTSCADKLNQFLAKHAQIDSPKLIWLDENISCEELHLNHASNNLTVVCNRIDDIESLRSLNIPASFSDFDLPTPPQKFDKIYYRLSKERFVSHHCINQSISALNKGGELILIGRKEDGIKTYADKCRKLLGAKGELKKDKSTYSITLQFPDCVDFKLDDGNYRKIREVAHITIGQNNFPIYSKPGVYGWKKIDSGTQFLVDTVSNLIENTNKPNEYKALDLGCGSGHLSLALHAWGVQNITATDNNAAAIAATYFTLNENNVSAEVVASNTASTILDTFDLILCNPPFHKGFDTSKTISESFIKATKKRLKPKGAAYFVTNAFVNIETPIAKHGLCLRQLANNKQFKVVEIRHR